MMPAPPLPDAELLEKMERMGSGLLPQLRVALLRLRDQENAGNPLTDDIRGWRAYYEAAIAHMEAYVAANPDAVASHVTTLKMT